MLSAQVFMFLLTVHIFLTRGGIALGMVATLVTIVLGLHALGSKINKYMRRQDKIDTAIIAMSQTVDDTKKIQEQISEVGIQLMMHVTETDLLLKKELRTNKGSSIKDQVTESTRELSGVTRDIAHLQATLNDHVHDGRRHVREHDRDPSAHAQHDATHEHDPDAHYEMRER